MAESGSVFSAPLLSDAWELSCSVYKSQHVNRSYVRSVISAKKLVVFAFRGSLEPNSPTKYGEYQIKPQDGFLEGMKDGNDQRPSVHQGALSQFQEIWSTSGVQKQVSEDYEKGNTIVFTGHAMGGGIAALATLRMLEMQRGLPKSVFCITFGFPLIGDEILARGVRRKKWADQFCHVVLRRDALSRILLVPSISVSKPLEALLPYWNRSMQSAADSMGSTDSTMAETLPGGIPEFVATVVQHCSAVSNYTSAAKMSPNNPLIAAVKPLVKLSPYRPFGHYLFCSSSGAILIENHYAVLPILYFSLQTLGANLEDFILQHVGYGYILPNALQNIVKFNELSDLPLSDAGSVIQDPRIKTQLDALGLGIQNCQARLALRAAGQVLKQQSENLAILEREYPKKMETPMEKLAEYRQLCLRNETVYYDAFKKKQRGNVDFQANLNRLELAGWWDEIIQNKFDKDELPDDFQCRKEWITRGTYYRLLVEPLDIANYYRLGKNEDSGPYLTHGRPRRYKTLEKWLKNNEEQLQSLPTKLTQDSCLWAHVEELACSIQKKDYKDEQGTKLENLVKALTDSDGLCKEDLMTGESTYNIVVDWLRKNKPLA
jgi:enhanced disease susceptibility 1 protein